MKLTRIRCPRCAIQSGPTPRNGPVLAALGEGEVEGRKRWILARWDHGTMKNPTTRGARYQCWQCGRTYTLKPSTLARAIFPEDDPHCHHNAQPTDAHIPGGTDARRSQAHHR